MAKACGNCVHAVAFDPPTGSCPPKPQRKVYKWWQYEPMLDFEYSLAAMKFARWKGQAARAEQDVQCRRYPEAETKRKNDWCGEFEQGAS